MKIRNKANPEDIREIIDGTKFAESAWEVVDENKKKVSKKPAMDEDKADEKTAKKTEKTKKPAVEEQEK